MDKHNTRDMHCESGDPCCFREEFSRLKKEVDTLSTLVSTDTLTELHNYRYFSDAISQEIERSQRTGHPTTLIMLDADHFKQVNDRWGHEFGNQALKMIAQEIKHNIRKLDIACRYGGEEFAVILPSTDISTSLQVAERMRTAVENHTLYAPQTEEAVQLTISLGIGSYTGTKANDDWHKLVERADDELYKAKQAGRNRVSHPADETLEQQVSKDEKDALFGMFKE